MFKLTFAESVPQMTTAFEDRIAVLRKQHQVLIITALPDFISMANIQTGESILDMKCGDGDLLVEMAGKVGESAGPIVGLDEDKALLRSARDTLKSKDLFENIRLLKADILTYDINTVSEALTKAQLPQTFDVIFAVDALPSTSAARTTALRTLAAYLTPTSGRMVVTFRHHDGVLGEIVGSVRFDAQNEVHHRTSWMLEAEWERMEGEFRALADGAGLHVEEMKRVGFSGVEAGSWVDESAHIDALARGSLTQDGMDADGNPSVKFKNGIKEGVANAYNEDVVNMSAEAVLVGACLVAVVKA